MQIMDFARVPYQKTERIYEEYMKKEYPSFFYYKGHQIINPV